MTATIPPPSQTESGDSDPLDIPVAVHGFVTDPKLVGYQILTNYEGTYWRPLVGNDAWSLYEVLRSFCHERKNTCHPSINLLMDILGLKQRRVLTGWETQVKGKQYKYPGFIEILQEHKLVVAEIQGEGPKMHYIFHVHMTPGLLTNNQLSQLPVRLQKKHTDLIERCEQATRILEAKRRPPKILMDSPPERNGGSGGSDNLSEGSDKLSGGSDKLSDKQHPINNTHITRARTRNDNNNSSGENDPQNTVVVALLAHNISEKVAQRLAQRYSQARIEEKIEYLAFLQEEVPERVKNPRGWLRRAIEENYGPPDGFVTAGERERQEVEAKRQAQTEEEQTQKNEEARRAFQKNKKTEEEAQQQALQERYGLTEHEIDLWQQVLSELKMQLTEDTFHTYAAGTQLLSLQDAHAVIGLANARTKDWVENRLSKRIGDILAMRLNGRKITATFVALEQCTVVSHGTESAHPDFSSNLVDS